MSRYDFTRTVVKVLVLATQHNFLCITYFSIQFLVLVYMVMAVYGRTSLKFFVSFHPPSCYVAPAIQIKIIHFSIYLKKCITGNMSSQLIDIDECDSKSDKVCANDARCINNPGSYECTCKRGFQGKGEELCEGNSRFVNFYLL